MKRSVNFSAPRQYRLEFELRQAAAAQASTRPTPPAWYTRAHAMMESLRTRASNPALDRAERQRLYELANTLSANLTQRFKSGPYMVETLLNMIDLGYNAADGMHATSPEGARQNLHRTSTRDCYLALLEAKKE